jgi:hypothetical protein
MKKSNPRKFSNMNYLTLICSIVGNVLLIPIISAADPIGDFSPFVVGNAWEFRRVELKGDLRQDGYDTLVTKLEVLSEQITDSSKIWSIMEIDSGSVYFMPFVQVNVIDTFYFDIIKPKNFSTVFSIDTAVTKFYDVYVAGDTNLIGSVRFKRYPIEKIAFSFNETDSGALGKSNVDGVESLTYYASQSLPGPFSPRVINSVFIENIGLYSYSDHQAGSSHGAAWILLNIDLIRFNGNNLKVVSVDKKIPKSIGHRASFHRYNIKGQSNTNSKKYRLSDIIYKSPNKNYNFK